MQSTAVGQMEGATSPSGQGINLLAIDGGGIRGLSALYILEQLMVSVNKKADNSPPLKPCEYFDMICGTSTGGIIAIMLGRLRMDVQECINVYLEMADGVFGQVHRLPINLRGRTHGRYNQEALQQAIENVLERKDLSKDTLLKDDDPYACKTFVCAKRLSSNALVTFTTFETIRVDRDLLNNATIVQACLATSAAPTYFEPVHIHLGPPGSQIKSSFIDGGMGYNNPIGVLWTQATTVWGNLLGGKVECLVSVGTGKPLVPDHGTSAYDLGQRLLEIATDSEDKADEFYEHHRNDLGRKHYFRFNVDRGLENVDLGEAQQKDRIVEVTKIWLKNGRVFDDMEDCAQGLASREWFEFLLPCLKSLYRLSRQNVDSSPSSALDDLAWLTNTKIFSAWMTPARGEIICSRWLWYPVLASRMFVQSFDTYFRSIGSEVIHVNCLKADAQMVTYGNLLAKFSGDCSVVVAVMMWVLISQALGAASLESPKAATRALNLLQMVLNKYKDDEIGRGNVIADLLRSTLNFRPDREVIILLHRADRLANNELVDLRNFVQDVMDSQRLPNVTQVRAFFTGPRSYDTEAALKGIVHVHETSEYNECVLSLKFKTMNLRRNRIINRNLDDSHWLWSNGSFRKWSTEPSGVLWIHGKPGSGKSVLARSIREHMTAMVNRDNTEHSEAGEKTSIVCDWFFSARDGLTSHRLMLRAMLLQMLSRESLLFEYVVHIYRRTKAEKKADDEWSTPDLEESLKILANAVRDQFQILWVIDGLDESDIEASGDAEPSRDHILLLLEHLTMSFNTIILSRSDLKIEQRLTRSHKIKLEDENRPDVERAVDEGLRTLFRPLDADISRVVSESDSNSAQTATATSNRDQSSAPRRPKFGQRRAYDARLQAQRRTMLSDFREHLVENASGVILWVVTVLAALQNRLARNPLYKAKDLWAELNSYPQELDELYRDIVTSMTQASSETINVARRALVWVNVATTHRPFQLQELREAVRIPTDPDETYDDEDPFDDISSVDDPPSFFRYVQTICGPFIERVKDRQSDTELDDENRFEIQWTDQIQLLHQSAKVFLETSSAAGPFRMPFDDAEEIVEQESRRYVQLALPARSCVYAPLPVWESTPFREAAESILEYLEEKALLSFILGVYVTAAEAVPDMYRHLFHSTLGPNVALEVRYDVRPTSSEFGPAYLEPASGSGVEHNIIVEYFFRSACEAGWNTAIENVFHLGSLRFPDEKWLWFREEVAILHGALIAAIENRLLPQVQKLAWYIEQRGIDLLDLPDDVRFGRGNTKEPVLVEKALGCGDQEIAITVIGYRDAEEKRDLLSIMQSRQRLALPSPMQDFDKRSVRDAVETVIGFWKRPATYDRPTGKLKDSVGPDPPGDSTGGPDVEPNWGPNIGLDLGLNSEQFGANVNAMTNSYMASQKQMFTAEMQAQNKMQQQTTEAEFAQKMSDAAWAKHDPAPAAKDGGDKTQAPKQPERIRRREWLSHQDLCRQVAILHGGRNANSVRLQPVDPKVGDPGDGDDDDGHSNHNESGSREPPGEQKREYKLAQRTTAKPGFIT